MTISATTQGIKPGVCTSTNRPVAPFDGQVIYMTDVDQTAVWDGTQWTVLAPIAGNRNVIINGDFKVWQRGTSIAAPAARSYLVDRWNASVASGVGRTYSRQTTSLDGFQYCIRAQRTLANTDTGIIAFSQSLETSNSIPFQGKVMVVSFYARAGANYSAASNALVVGLVSGTGTDQKRVAGDPSTYTGNTYLINTSVTLTTSWQRFTVTSTTVGVSATELALFFQQQPVGTAGAADYYEITGVQLEAGAVATPFEFEDYGTTLAKCQRYYQRITGLRNFGSVTAQTSTDAYGLLPLPVSMRVPPTSVDSNTLRAFDLFNAATTISAVTIESSSSESYAATKIVTTGMTGFRTYYIINNGATSYLGFSAEL